MTYQLSPVDRASGQLLESDKICSQEILNPVVVTNTLSVSRGSTVVLQYKENDHITEPYNNAIGRSGIGTVYVYGTTNAQDWDLSQIHHVWNAEGTGSNGEGKLLYQRSFDDGACYQYSLDSPIRKARMALHSPPGESDRVQNQVLWCRNDVVMLEDIDQASYSVLGLGLAL